MSLTGKGTRAVDADTLRLVRQPSQRVRYCELTGARELVGGIPQVRRVFRHGCDIVMELCMRTLPSANVRFGQAFKIWACSSDNSESNCSANAALLPLLGWVAEAAADL